MEARRRLVLAGAIALSATGCASLQEAPPYPTKPVRVLIPYPVGNTVDVFGRAVTDKLAQLWGQPVTVENRPGIPSIDSIAKAPPDGYTLLVHGMSFALDAAMYTNLPYTPETDFAAVAPFATQSFVLIASPTLGVKTVADLVAMSKARPGRMKFASYGPTSAMYLLAEQLKKETGADAGNLTVPGLIEGNAATAQGGVAFWMPPVAGAMAAIRDGKVVPLAVTGEKRSPMLPQVPTLEEAGVRNMTGASGWFGMWAPAGVPRPLVERISRDVARALDAPEVREKLLKAGATPLTMTPSQFGAFVHREIESSRRFSRELGIPPMRYAAPAK